ncbi:MAG TPA: enoyl-CoA hydratase/isomerase family protein [Pyrinomonadaceae bacterium]|nr:enoyl-CoA hydratase/isomerase family protein [Pyrinomonadaceae bacterium]
MKDEILSFISVETAEKLLIIRFTNPKERNPLSIKVLEGLNKILNTIPENIDRVIFTGVDNIFASGANLNEIAKVTVDTAREYALRGQNLMLKISELPQETVALVNGFCFGGALDLALSCKKRIATPNAIFCHPGANLGIMTGWGGTQRLPRLIGEAKALEMFLTAKQVGAEEALQIGLIDEIIP